MMNDVKLYLALPVLKEFANLPALVELLNQQTERNFRLVACVDHYEHWRKQAEFEETISDNEKSLEYLLSVDAFPVTIIDHALPGKGWSLKNGGVGWARKMAMDAIAKIARPEDIIVSIDADTYYPPNYLSEIKKIFNQDTKAVGLSIPYYHELVGNDTDKLILRYELYMRHYALNMLLIKNPYAFTAMGSAMAFPVWAYQKVGGITPVKSGEDFYFIQKLVKTGRLMNWCETVAYPSPRFSNRVLFGTGPALIKGNTGDWTSYPIYHPELFIAVATTFSNFGQLYIKDMETPMDEFLFSCFKVNDLWQPLRKNYRSMENFVRACINKVDGLRILQFLRQQQQLLEVSDAQVFAQTYQHDLSLILSENQIQVLAKSGFNSLTTDQLDFLRNRLFQKENSLRKEMQFNCL